MPRTLLTPSDGRAPLLATPFSVNRTLRAHATDA